MEAVGCTDSGYITKDTVVDDGSGKEQTTLNLSSIKGSSSEKIWSIQLQRDDNEEEGGGGESTKEDICHVTVQRLRNLTPENLADGSSFWLIGLVKVRRAGEKSEYSGELSLVQQGKDDVECKIVEKMVVVQWQEYPLQMHFLSNFAAGFASSDDPLSGQSVRNGLIVLFLSKCVMLYILETVLAPDVKNRMEILSSECATKSFWWAQWVPEYNFLAVAQTKKVLPSSFDEDSDAVEQSKPIFSALQFHEKYPRENVLNLPLEISSHAQLDPRCQLVRDPRIFHSSGAQMRFLAHSSGAISLFELESVWLDEEVPHISYSLLLLHHNKNIKVTANLPARSVDEIKIDLCLHSRGQYVVVLIWPFYVHLLDVGVCHEPSHHLVVDLKVLIPTEIPVISLWSSNDNVPKDGVKFILKDCSVKNVPFDSSTLLPLWYTEDISFRLSALHLLLVHLGDENAAKRAVHDACKNIEDLNLKKIFQEYVVGAAFSQTKKQHASSFETYLLCLPYCPLVVPNVETEKIKITCEDSPSQILTVLLSPRQRVIPHNMRDLWTMLWETNNRRNTCARFNHKKMAEKLMLTLQCYKPEALSRASTPMSPSSPLICASIGDIAGIFSRRMQDLQLPFLENESCTASKQEYIFSVTLRELSMHLLKERKDWPLHGHTVAGKYVNALVDTARLLCHIICLTVHLQPMKNRDKGFRLIDSLPREKRVKLFLLFEHYSMALTDIACPLPQGFLPFFTYLGYRVVPFHQFLWHVRSGTFDLTIDIVKSVMSDLPDSDEGNVGKKLHLISMLPKSRAHRVLNGWSHPRSVCLRARQHSTELLHGLTAQGRKSAFVTNRKWKGDHSAKNDRPLDSFFKFLTLKANAADIDLGLLTEATMLSMEGNRHRKC